jgi:hypothetical protein
VILLLATAAVVAMAVDVAANVGLQMRLSYDY